MGLYLCMLQVQACATIVVALFAEFVALKKATLQYFITLYVHNIHQYMCAYVSQEITFAIQSTHMYVLYCDLCFMYQILSVIFYP